jgi:hypothetical protein
VPAEGNILFIYGYRILMAVFIAKHKLMLFLISPFSPYPVCSGLWNQQVYSHFWVQSNRLYSHLRVFNAYLSWATTLYLALCRIIIFYSTSFYSSTDLLPFYLQVSHRNLSIVSSSSSSTTFHNFLAQIAQWLARWASDWKVAGSNPGLVRCCQCM